MIPEGVFQALAARTVQIGDCLVWQGPRERGAGFLRTADRRYAAHRLAYELHHGPIPQFAAVDQTCGERACLAPAHLVLRGYGVQGCYDDDPESGCWVWCGYKDVRGYGRLGRDGKFYVAHRYSWSLRNGPIPEGMELDHLCQRPSCINPDHLELVTPEENKRRQWPAHKLSCANGHRYDAANTYRRPNGRRDCRACIRDRTARYAKRKASVA